MKKIKKRKEREYCIYILKKETPVYGNGRCPQKKVGPKFVKKILKKLKKRQRVFATFINAAKILLLAVLVCWPRLCRYQ